MPVVYPEVRVFRLLLELYFGAVIDPLDGSCESFASESCFAAQRVLQSGSADSKV